MKIGAVLLCSGTSSRMGKENKLMMEINGVEMYKYAVKIADELPFFKRVTVTGYKEISPSGHEVIYNGEPERGLSLSVMLGTLACRECDGVMYFVCDQPGLKSGTVRKMIETFLHTNKIIVPVSGGKRGNPCIFPRRYFKELSKLCGDKGGRRVIEKHMDDVEYVRAEECELFDIDTVEDMDEAEKIIHNNSL